MAVNIRIKRDDNIILDTSVESLSISKKLDQSASWQFKIPRNTVDELSVVSGDFVEIFSDGVLLVEGFIQSLTLANGDTASYDVSGRDLIDNLFIEAADTSASFEDVPVVEIFANILYKTGWRLGDVDTFEDLEKALTVDLRSNETLFSQIKKVLEAFSGISFRYAGISGGVPRIDIGTFGEKQNLLITNTPDRRLVANEQNVIGIEQINQSQELEITSYIEGFGGDITEAGEKRKIDLRDVLLDDITWMGDPEYRIIEYITGKQYAMINNVEHKKGGVLEWNVDAATGHGIGSIGTTGGVVHYIAQTFRGIEGFLEAIDLKLWRNVADSGTLRIELAEYDESTPTDPYTNPVLATWDFTASDILPSNQIEKVRLQIPEADRYYCDGTKHYILVYSHPDYVLNSNARFIAYYQNSETSVYSEFLRSVNGGASWTNVAWNLKVKLHFTEEPVNGRVAVSKQFSEYATPDKRANASSTAIAGAAKGLASRCRAYLQDRSQLFRTVSINGNGISSFPIVGDKAYVNFTRRSGIYDPNNANYTIVTDAVQEWLRCVSVGAKYSTNGLSWDLELTNSPVITNEQFEVEIYKASREESKKPQTGTPVALIDNPPTLVSSTTNIPIGTLPNYIYNGQNAYKVTVALPTRPDIEEYIDVTLITNPVISNANANGIKGYVITDFDFVNGIDAEIVFVGINGWNATLSTDYRIHYLWT